MMKNKYGLILLVGIIGGLFLTIFYIKPITGIITLSEFILQLSGSRGEFALGFSFSELTSFGMRLFPAFIFELYGGIMLYQHFCTASIFVFSRYPRRVKWYVMEILKIGILVFGFQIVLLFTAITTTNFCYTLQVDKKGIILLIYYFCIYSLWIYIMTVIVNFIAIYFGSNTGYGFAIGFQLVCIALINVMNLIVQNSDNKISYEQVLMWNPISYLILGWHNSSLVVTNATQNSYLSVDLYQSLVWLILLAVSATFVGALIIKNHDLLIADMETGVA